jgi:hypothetical protein
MIRAFAQAVLRNRIRFRRLRKFLGLPNRHPDPLVTSTDPAPDPSIIKKNNDFSCFVTSLWVFIFEELHKFTSVPDPDAVFLGLPDPLVRGTGPRIRIRIRIRTRMSRIRNNAHKNLFSLLCGRSHCWLRYSDEKLRENLCIMQLLTRKIFSHWSWHKSARISDMCRSKFFPCRLCVFLAGKRKIRQSVVAKYLLFSSVPDPPDPHVFGPPGSGSTSQRYGSGTGSFYHHAKIIRKTLIPSILWLLLTFYLWKIM